METDPKIIIALDFAQKESVFQFLDQVEPDQCRVKVGKELFVSCGPDLVRQIIARGFDVFLDLKFHDIPHTVARACAVAADMGVWMLNVHASGGIKMMQAAREALEKYTIRPKLIAVTILTSLTERELRQVGYHLPAGEQVIRLANLAAESGLDGVVCSPLEAEPIREQISVKDFLLVTPGVRPENSSLDDQKRVMTPVDAIAAGSDYLVIGRPITRAERPLAALQQVISEINNS